DRNQIEESQRDVNASRKVDQEVALVCCCDLVCCGDFSIASPSTNDAHRSILIPIPANNRLNEIRNFGGKRDESLRASNIVMPNVRDTFSNGAVNVLGLQSDPKHVSTVLFNGINVFEQEWLTF